MQTTDNLRKAAIVLHALGGELVGDVLRALPGNQLAALDDQLEAMDEITPGELNDVLTEFLVIARQAVVRRSLPPEVPEDDPDPEGLGLLTRLNELEAPALWRVLREERPQTVAAVLSHLTAARAGQLLVNFDEAVAADIAYRAAHLTSPSPGAMKALALALDHELQAVRVRSGAIHEVSLQFVVDLIGSMPPDRSKLIIAALQDVDKDFGEGVAEQVFTFEDLASLPDSDLQRLLRNIDMGVLVLALKGTPQELRERVKQNLSQRGRERLDEEMEMLGAVAISQVQEAQRQICHEARALAEAGEIHLDAGGMEYVE